MRHKMSRWFLVAGAVLAILGGVLFLWQTEQGQTWLRALGDRELLERLVAQMGPWAPLVIVVAEMLQVLLAPIPGQAVGIVAGYLYGVFWGTLLCEAGLILGSLIAIWLARQLGRPLVERIAGAAFVERIDSYVEKRGAWALFLIFLLPFLPDDTVCLIAGLTRIRISELLLIAAVGRLPGLVVSTLIGSQAHDLTGTQLLIVVVVGALLALCFFVYQARLEQVMFRLLDRFRQD